MVNYIGIPMGGIGKKRKHCPTIKPLQQQQQPQQPLLQLQPQQEPQMIQPQQLQQNKFPKRN